MKKSLVMMALAVALAGSAAFAAPAPNEIAFVFGKNDTGEIKKAAKMVEQDQARAIALGAKKNGGGSGGAPQQAMAKFGQQMTAGADASPVVALPRQAVATTLLTLWKPVSAVGVAKVDNKLFGDGVTSVSAKPAAGIDVTIKQADSLAQHQGLRLGSLSAKPAAIMNVPAA